MFARFDENTAMTLQDIKKTKRYGRMDARTHRRTYGRTTFAGGYKQGGPRSDCSGSKLYVKEAS